MERKYDEDLSNNQFFNYIRHECTNRFEKAITMKCVICIPKADTSISLTTDSVENHMLIPINLVKDVFQEFLSMSGNEILLSEGYLMLKNSRDKRIHVLFEETFYEKEFGRYEVLCINDSITSLLNKEITLNSESRDYLDINVLESMRSVYDFSEYICKVTQNSLATDVIDDLISDFLSLPYSAVDHFKKDTLKTMIYEIYDKSIKSFYNTMKSLSEYKQTALCISIESYIIYHLYKELFKASTFAMAAKDEALNRILHSVKDYTPSFFNIKVSNLNILLSARYELTAINNFKSPFGKLQCIKRAFECLEKGNTLSSDDLLPILVFCIIKSNLSNWFSNLHFIQNYHFSLKSVDKYSFILSSLEAALVYILSEKVRDYQSNCCVADLPMYHSEFANENPDYKLQKTPSISLSQLFNEIKRGNLDGVKTILENNELQDVYLNILDVEDKLCHPLCDCAKCKITVSNSKSQITPCNVNSVDDTNMSPLHLAAKLGYADIVEYFLDNGANVDACNIDGMTPLHFSAYKGHQTVLLLLLNSGSCINSFDNDKNTALHFACIAGHESCVKALIFYAESEGLCLDFSAVNILGDTALHLASYWGYPSIVKLLLSQFNINECLDIKNKRNQTPFDCAHSCIISSLLNDSSQIDTNSNTSYLLINLKSNSHSKDSNKQALKDSNIKDTQVKTAVEDLKVLRKVLNAITVNDVKLACFYLNTKETETFSRDQTNPETCHPLCQCAKCITDTVATKRCNLNLINTLQDNYGALHTAVISRNYEMCQILLQNGADPDLVTQNEKQTSLHLAVVEEQAEIIKLLVKFNANVNAVDTFGNTPLHMCCIRGCNEAVSLLLKFGASTNINNMEELSPLEEAERNGHSSIIEILINRMNN